VPLVDWRNSSRSSEAKPTPSVSLRPGTRLVREWHAVTHTALIHADGIEWRGQRYSSLSVVARKITGARWSGPRFFGLRRQLDSHSSGHKLVEDRNPNAKLFRGTTRLERG
jgi:hypothetical protein